MLLDSHEKGPPSFLGGGCGTGAAVFEGAGGGAHGTEGRFPERPCILGGGLGGRIGMLATLSLDVMVVEREREEAASWELSS